MKEISPPSARNIGPPQPRDQPADAPTKTVVTEVCNRLYLSICTRSLSAGDVHIAWV